MKYIRLFEKFKELKRMRKASQVHFLSGIILIVEGRVLLVNAKKHSRSKFKWSIPKGHIEGGDALASALSELEEESGIVLDRNYDKVFKYDYMKSGKDKIMDVYVYYRERSEVEEYLKGWDIRSSYLNRHEITEARFFTIQKARYKIDISMQDILDQF